ncbi:MAG: DUF4113 domain-containing protein, partial [Bacteroidota bacterium]
NQAAAELTVFLMANPFRNLRPDRKSYFARTVELPLATGCTNDLITWANLLTRKLYEKGTNYKKAGVMATALVPAASVQGNLFVSEARQAKSVQLMKALDALNGKMGRNAVYFAACGHAQKRGWSRKEQWRSPRYTTRWEEILKVKI